MNPIRIIVHPSQFPDAIRAELDRSLRERTINHKFHYESHKQAAKWLALHEAYSPARTDPNCAAIYEAAFTRAASILSESAHAVHIIGLGCGGGQKEAQLLHLLSQQNKA